MFRLHEAQRDCQESLRGQDGTTSIQLSCLNALSQEAFSRKKMLQELQQQVLKAQEELVETSRSRKVMEKLRDREFERQRQHILKAERNFLDEIAAGRFIRMTPHNSETDI